MKSSQKKSGTALQRDEAKDLFSAPTEGFLLGNETFEPNPRSPVLNHRETESNVAKNDSRTARKYSVFQQTPNIKVLTDFISQMIPKDKQNNWQTHLSALDMRRIQEKLKSVTPMELRKTLKIDEFTTKLYDQTYFFNEIASSSLLMGADSPGMISHLTRSSLISRD